MFYTYDSAIGDKPNKSEVWRKTAIKQCHDSAMQNAQAYTAKRKVFQQMLAMCQDDSQCAVILAAFEHVQAWHAEQEQYIAGWLDLLTRITHSQFETYKAFYGIQ